MDTKENKRFKVPAELSRLGHKVIGDLVAQLNAARAAVKRAEQILHAEQQAQGDAILATMHEFCGVPQGLRYQFHGDSHGRVVELEILAPLPEKPAAPAPMGAPEPPKLDAMTLPEEEGCKADAPVTKLPPMATPERVARKGRHGRKAR